MNNPAPRDRTRSHLRPVVFSPTPQEPPPPARPLSWRSPGTLILAALLAFQIGLVGTLLWTLGRPPPEAPRGAVLVRAPVVAAPATELQPGVGSEAAAPEAPAVNTAPAAPAVSTAPAAPAVGTTPANPAVGTAPVAPAPSSAPAAGPAAPAPVARRPSAPRPSPAAERSAAPEPPPPPSPSPVVTPQGLVEVEIRSEPEGAEVHIAGALWGLTPLTALLPPGSPVAIELKLNDYAPARLSWSSASKSRTLNAVLRPLKDL